MKESEARQAIILAALSLLLVAACAVLAWTVERPALERIETALEILNTHAETSHEKVERVYVFIKTPTAETEEAPVEAVVEETASQETAAATEWTHALTDAEFVTACKIVMGEAGGESYEGKLAVAQCILSACKRDGIEPSEVRTQYRYAGWSETYTADVERAVYAVFHDGERVCEEDIIFFYAPRWCTSKWHESQLFVTEIGGHRFFAERV